MAHGMSNEPHMTRAFAIQSWMAFIAAFGTSLTGIVVLPLDAWMRGFLAVAFLFTVNSAFALAKIVRDRHEQDRLLSRLDEARTEEILKRFATHED